MTTLERSVTGGLADLRAGDRRDLQFQADMSAKSGQASSFSEITVGSSGQATAKEGSS